MRRNHLLTMCALLLGWTSLACSAAQPVGARPNLKPSLSGGSSGSMGPGGTDIDQPSDLMTPPVGAMMARAGASAAMPSSHDPIAIDLCTGLNPAGLADADVKLLLAGGTGPGAKWLYPYDNTVFPRGLGAPLLMWDGPADAIYVHVTAKAFEYKACVKPPMKGQFQLPQDVWVAASQKTYGKSEPYTLELTTLNGGIVAGPSAQHFIIAQANIKGSVYYNSYNSNLAAMSGGFGGVVLRIPPGGSAEVFISDPGCNGCHTVSADGSRMLSQVSTGGGQAFQLVVNGSTNPKGIVVGPRTAWGALYPDGSRYLASSAVIDIGNTIMGGGGGGPEAATLYDTMTGQPAMSTGIPTGALMPMFSPDGTLLVFNDYALDNGHGLAIMNYDVKTHTATPMKTLLQETGTLRPGWPFVLPDNHGVVFVRTDANSFSGEGAGINFGGAGGINLAGLTGAPDGGAPISDLNIVDIASGKVIVLAHAMGYLTVADAETDKTYLPFGATDLHHNFFPTVSPVAAGGYFWVFFDSLRNYGNLGVGRQLWGTALEIHADGTYVEDPSNPPFYLPGQEFGTGNHRAFTALDPCKADGNSCTSGIDCCGGFCYLDTPAEEFGEPNGTCTPKQKTMCSQKDERCMRDSDCCTPLGSKSPYSCIGGFCAVVTLN